MRILTCGILIILALPGATAESSYQARARPKSIAGALPPRSLCATDEHIIFSCSLKALAKQPAKMVSLCASRDLDRKIGYLQYRFGLPDKIELEFPKDRLATQQQFHYTHYFRFQVDLTEINFNLAGYQYQIFDTYNGEEKPPITEQGVSVSAAGKAKDVTFVCRGKAKADYSTLEEVLGRDDQTRLAPRLQNPER